MSALAPFAVIPSPAPALHEAATPTGQQSSPLETVAARACTGEWSIMRGRYSRNKPLLFLPPALGAEYI
jgi:hypothetical protein